MLLLLDTQKRCHRTYNSLHGGSGAVIYFACRTMPQIRLEPPATFNFTTPAEWQRWRNRLEQFWFTSALFDDDPEETDKYSAISHQGRSRMCIVVFEHHAR